MISEKVKVLEELKQQCYSCTACTLHKNIVDDRDPHVFAYGNVNPVLAVVAMNPGVDETKKKRPLIGASGIFYENEILKGIGLTRKQVYTTNVVRFLSTRKVLDIVDPSISNTSFLYHFIC